MSKGKWIPIDIKTAIINDFNAGGNAICISSKYNLKLDAVNKIKQKNTDMCKKYKNSKVCIEVLENIK